MEKQKVVVIGAGFGGLGAAILMARKGYDVTVLEKNDTVGGRANLLEKKGFKWDMGPSWYLMPDAFERYFEAIGRKVSDYLDLKKLEPSYRVYFKAESGKQKAANSVFIDLYADVEKAADTFESIEKGSGDQLKKYLKSSAYQYDIAMNKFVFKNYDSIFDFMTPQLAIEGLQLNIFSTLYNYVSRFVKTENLKKILMYPSVFLGTSPYQTPALFNIMSHVDFNQGVFYPQGGIYEVPKALYKIALEEGVKFEFGTEVEKVVVESGEVRGVEIMKRHREGTYGELQINIQSKPNIIVLHGKKRPERNSNKEGWFGWIENQLTSKGYNVKLPFIDDSWKKGRTGWKEGIEEFQDSINENTILVGHSAGATALVRWLGETGRRIKKLILVAPGYIPEKDKTISTQTGLPIDPQEQLEYNTLFDFDVDGSILDQIEDGVILFTSNDSQRLLDSAYLYEKALGAKRIILEDRGHFNTSYGPQNLVFEELFDVITKENIDMISSENIDTFLRENLHFPIMIHGFEKSGASFFTIELVKKLIQQGKKVLFFSKYQAAKDALVENRLTYELVGGGQVLRPDSQLQIYHDGNDQAFADYLQKTTLDEDHIIVIKNIETCSDILLKEISGKRYVISGDCTQLYPTFVGKVISFSELGNYDISHLKQYEALVIDKYNNDKSNNSNNLIPANIVISNADMRHTETKLLDSTYQTYPQSYWEKQVISPSGFIMYLGVDGELPQFKHHTLVFNDDWKTGFDQIFKTPQWPNDPSYYICNPSKTDPSVAPVGKENLFVLVPIAPGLASTPDSLQQYADKILDDISVSCNVPDLKKRVEVCELFSVPQFEQYYNAYKGTALGLAHTMFQSAVWRPNNYSKKAKGLYYSGGYTTPGIGMPMCLISAMLVAERIFKKNS